MDNIDINKLMEASKNLVDIKMPTYEINGTTIEKRIGDMLESQNNRIVVLENTVTEIANNKFSDYRVEDIKDYYQSQLDEAHKAVQEVMKDMKELRNENRRLIQRIKFEEEWEQ